MPYVVTLSDKYISSVSLFSIHTRRYWDRNGAPLPIFEGPVAHEIVAAYALILGKTVRSIPCEHEEGM
jgi:hypothetical protein